MRLFLIASFIFIISLVGVRVSSGSLPIADVDDVYPIVPNWQGLTVLHIGDSHVSAGLLKGLARRFNAVGARYRPVCWVGSRSKSWIASGKLKQLIRKHRPDAVIVTLGTNTISDGRPNRHSGWVRKLARKLKGRHCYWLGPPPLLDDQHGFNEMLSTTTKPCRYFDSRLLNIPKRDDGKFHLTKAQGETWAGAVWAWMNGEIAIQASTVE